MELIKKRFENFDSFLKNYADPTTNPRAIENDAKESLHTYLDKPNKKNEDEANSKLTKAITNHTVDNHILIIKSLPESYQPVAVEVINQLTKEFQCKTTSEKILAEVAGYSYARYLLYTRNSQLLLDVDFLSSQKNGYYGLIGKEAEMAIRQYTSAISNLRQMRAPTVNLHFKDSTAYVAQNQQNIGEVKPNDQQ